MDDRFSRKEIAGGVHFSRYIDDRFKINRIDVIFTDKLSRDSAPLNALFPKLLSRSSAEFPTMRELNIKLSGLYSASLGDMVTKRGDIQLYGLFASAIDDEYAIDGENVTEELVRLLCGCLFEPVLENGVFPEKSVELQKQNLIDANDAEINDKSLYSYRKGTEESFRGEPAAISVYGENEDIRKVTPKAAFDTYRDALLTKNVEIICVGRSDFAEAEKLLGEAFAKLGRKPLPRPENRRSPLKSEPASVALPLDVTQSKLFLAFKTDCADRNSLLVMCSLFGGDVTSKLFTVVREKLSLCYYCFSRLLREKGAMVVESGVEPGNVEKAKAEILHQLDEIKNGSFTDEDVEKIKRSMQNDLRSVNDWAGSIVNWYLNRILDGNIETPDESCEKLMAVTRDEIISAAGSMSLDTVHVICPSGKESV